MGPYPERSRMDAADDFHTTWMPTAAAVGHGQTPKAEPMRRISSKGSASGHKITKTSSSKSRSGLQTALSQGASQASSFDITGNESAYVDGLPGNGHALDSPQFLFQPSNGLTTSPDMLYSHMDGLHGASALNDFVTTQHVDPSAIPLDFETSMSGGSPTETWISEVTTPPRDENWTLVMHNSPITSVSSNSPTIPVMDNFSLVGPAVQPMVATRNLEVGMPTVVGDEQIQSNDWAGSHPAGEGENARDHPLYRNAFPQADGLYHCPWEGQSGCCHKPEKLKCNYDKFVDSHLKPYRCKMESCKELPFSSTACLLRHEREAHGMHGHGTKPYPCTYKGCDRATPGNGFPRKWNLHDHMQRVHNAAPPSPEEDGRKDSIKSRKRKSESTSNNTSGRKSPKSRKSSPKMEPPEAPAKVDMSAKLREEWSNLRAGLPNAVAGFDQLDDPMVMMHINRLKDSLDALGRVHTEYMRQQQRSQPFVQQSG